jgi:hypothetical protein
MVNKKKRAAIIDRFAIGESVYSLGVCFNLSDLEVEEIIRQALKIIDKKIIK